MEGLNNSNAATVNTNSSSSTTASNSALLAFNLPLDSFASAPTPAQWSANPGVLAICLTNEASGAVNCYWRAVSGGVPDIAFNDCATMLTGLSGSRASEQRRQVGILKETASFVREMNPHPTTTTASFKDTGHTSPTCSSGVGETGVSLEDEFDIRTRVDATLTITSNDAKMNTWFGFKSNGALYLRGDGWDDMDIRESIVAALELAEEQLECTSVYLCLEKSNPHLIMAHYPLHSRTLIEADSDLWVAETLAPDLAKQQEDLIGKILWTDLQDLLLQRLFERGITQQDLEKTLHQIPFTPEVIAALRLMKAQGAELCILSDANTFYIDCILKAHGLEGVFTKILTNPAHFDAQGRLHVARFHGLDKEPHNCPLPCQLNLCKGQELQKLIDSQNWDQVIYMGDSTNDFCPSTRLQERDIVLARADLLLEKHIKLHLDMVKAQVIYWQSPADVLTITQDLFNIPPVTAVVNSKPVPAVSSAHMEDLPVSL
ncbi:hypothetical protein BG015_001028 [Linnemannia schmuckeri]|uniref:Phosphatase n=1 Tax=Linnemannia schmuckeri TaxID=64567 RepID=A0A9P5S6E4_9FUNG|nr:hypothetical protein BG015_001028 [Linnemannia schmuckeri]